MSSPSHERIVDPARDAAQLLVRLGFVILFVGAPLGAVFSRRLLFILMPLGSALMLAAAALDVPGGAVERLRRLAFNPVSIALLGLLAWTGLSLLWTPFLSPASERYVKTLGTIVLATTAAGLLPARTKTSNLYLVPIGVVLGAIGAGAALVFMPELFRPGGDVEGSILDRAALGLALLLWPTLGAVSARERWIYGGIVAVAVSVTAITVWMPGAMLGLGVGALAAVTGAADPRKAGRVWGGLFAVLFVLSPAIIVGLHQLHFDRLMGQAAAGQQLGVWADLINQEGLRLVTGHGFDTLARSVVAGYLPAQTPKSVLFEIWYELGILGALAMALLIYRMFRQASRHPSSIAPFHIGGLVCLLVIALTGESTFQLWWITMVSMAGIAFAGAAAAQYRSDRPGVVIEGRRPTAAA